MAANFSAVKKLDRHLKAIDKALDKGYNHDVLEKIEVAQAALALMDSPSDLIHAKLLTKACTAQGRMKRFEDVRAGLLLAAFLSLSRDSLTVLRLSVSLTLSHTQRTHNEHTARASVCVEVLHVVIALLLGFFVCVFLQGNRVM